MKMMYSEPLVKLLTGKGAFGIIRGPSGAFEAFRSLREPSASNGITIMSTVRHWIMLEKGN